MADNSSFHRIRFLLAITLLATFGLASTPAFAIENSQDVFSAGEARPAGSGPLGRGYWIKLGPQHVHGSNGPYMWIPNCDEPRDHWLYGVVVYGDPQPPDRGTVHRLHGSGSGTGTISPASPSSIRDPEMQRSFQLYAQQQSSILGRPCPAATSVPAPPRRPSSNAPGATIPPYPPSPYANRTPRVPTPSQNMCTTCDCGADGGGPESANAYVGGFLQGFGSCLGGVFMGPIQDLMADGHDFTLVGQALLQGDSATAAQLLAIKGDRNRAQFDQFVRSIGPSLNPKIFGATPRQAGLRDGARLCSFGVVPGIIKSLGGKPLPSRGRFLPLSGIALRRRSLTGASALVPISSKTGGVAYVFEAAEGGNLPPGFEGIDAVPPGEMAQALLRDGLIENPSEIVSVKTLSATPAQYVRPGSVLSALKKYMRDLNSYQDRCRNGIRVIAGPNTQRILKLGIPASATAQHLQEVDQAGLLARQLGIDFQVTQLEGVTGW